jgi:integrase
MAKALTVKRLERIEKDPAPTSRQEIPDGLLVGLYLVRQPSKAMSWAVRYRHAGQPRKLTLGSYPAIKLEAARDLGSNALRAAAEGRDPAQEKQNAKVEAQRKAAEEIRGQRDLFENVAREFIERYARPRAAAKNRPDAWQETGRILGLKPDPEDSAKLIEGGGDVMPCWRGRKIHEITKRDIILLLDTVHDRAPIMANRVLSAVRKLFNWAVARDIVAASPCAGVNAPAAENSRDRVLTDDELRLVWAAADNESWPFGPIVQLMILTGQREGEIAGMRWQELDLERKVWTLPATRVKNDELHTVPLSDAAVEIIKALPHVKTDGGFVFAGRRGKPVTSFARAKERIDYSVTKANKGTALPDWVFHDIRRTVASGMAGLGIQLPVIEKVLNHKSGTFRGIVGVYQRHSFAEEKRTALAAWASHVQSVLSGKQPDNVVNLRKAGVEA